MEWTKDIPTKSGTYVLLDKSMIYSEQLSIVHVSRRYISDDKKHGLWAKGLSFYGPIKRPPR